MACFLVPAAEAAITTIAKRVVKNKESEIADKCKSSTKIKFSEKLGWLNKMLWGGSGLLAFEHLWHGEISPFFPFLTSLSNPADTVAMLQEMAVSGVGMALLVTAVWGVLVIATNKIKNRNVLLTVVEEAATE